MATSPYKPPQTTAREAIVAANVRRLREAAGLTQPELASLAAKAGHDLGEQVVGNIEGGRRRIRIDDLFALGDVLGVQPTSLLLPGAMAGVTYEITFEGGNAERVTADDYKVDERWIHFHLQGQLVYFAASARVLGVRIAPDGGES